MSNLADLFDVSDVETKALEVPVTGGNFGKDYFKPSPKDGKGGVYEAVVRFIPYLKDKDKTIVKKHEVYLEHPDGKSKSVYSYRSIGKADECPIVRAYFDLKKQFDKTKDASIEAKMKKLVQREKWWVLVQILEDNNKPENVGKIMVWNIGNTLINKIQEEMNTNGSKKGRNVFDIFKGRLMNVKVGTKKDYPNYDLCSFERADEFNFPVYIGEGGKELEVTPDNAKQTKLYADFLLANSPDMTLFEFKEWDEETSKFVNDCIQAFFGNYSSSGTIRSSVTITDDEDDDFSPKPAATQKKKQAVIVDDEEELINPKITSKKAKPVVSLDDEDFDDFDIDGFDDED